MAGEVTDAEGDSLILRENGRSIQAREGTALFPGDEITTGPDASLRFTLSGIGEFALAGDTRLDLAEVFSGEEDEPGVLSLAAGYLWSRVDTGGKRTVEVHTPTTVAGVRGTEFETVAALDGSTAVAVDEGTVEVTVGEEAVMVGPGQMSGTGPDLAPEPPAPAPEKARRDWGAWRKTRRENLMERLPAGAARLRATMERLDQRAQRDRERMLSQAETLARDAARLKGLAKTRGPEAREARKEAWKRFADGFQGLRGTVQSFRGSISRARACARLCHVVSAAFEKERERYGDQAPAVEADLKRVEELAREMKRDVQGLRREIREKFKDFRKLARGREKAGS